MQSLNREIWEGQSGIGVANALDAIDRALELAEKRINKTSLQIVRHVQMRELRS